MQDAGEPELVAVDAQITTLTFEHCQELELKKGITSLNHLCNQ